MKTVVDASVAVKWFLPDDEAEADADRALALLAALRDGRIEIVQPPHWLAEVAAVAARLRPEIAHHVFRLLDAMELPVADEPEVYETAIDLAVDHQHHLFDTLYHATAVVRQAELVTADDRYHRKVGHLPEVVPLADWQLPENRT
ncbi:MAG TPA: type II toxin-antitoxin system VapC family toxin [Thermoanaerobaculia bacterium]|nr:type II toxin-antitoxin system VapC family toxin [Thermoanaerobaculia bacterium]